MTADEVQQLLDLQYKSVGTWCQFRDLTWELIRQVPFVEEYRWAIIRRLVLQDLQSGDVYGFDYESPSTEAQEDQDDWSYIDPEFKPMRSITRIEWVYE